MTDFTTEEERLALEALMSDFQTGGVTMSASIDPYWFFEETGDEQDRMDRLMLFMLRYFPRSFTTWEPIDHIVLRFLEYENRGLILLPAQHGKDLDCDTPILTTDGWKTMGTVQVGDFVYGPQGQPTEVMYCSETFTDHRCYQLTFADGAEIVAGEDHLWTVKDEADHGKVKTIPTGLLASRTWKRQQSNGSNKYNFAVRCDAKIAGKQSDLPIDPYILGYWLGDGHSDSARITVGEGDLPHLREQITKAGYRVVSEYKQRGSWLVTFNIGMVVRDGFMSRAKRLGILGNKRIPMQYLVASAEQRLALLAGLLDSDGTISQAPTWRSPRVEFCCCSRELANDVHQLMRSLGIRVGVVEADATIYGRCVGTRFRMAWTPTFNPFRLKRKAQRFAQPASNGRKRYISIVDIKTAPTRPTRCIQVANPDGIYLAGRLFTPTHNTTILQRWLGAWVPLQCPSISMIYTEKNLPTACKRSRAIRLQLEGNKLLIHDFGQFKPSSSSTYPWSDEQWTIAQRKELVDSPTFACFGAAGASLLGNRCNVLCVDDPVTPENSRSDKERDNLFDWHSEAASTCPAPLPVEKERYLVKEFLIGTVFRRDDLFHRVDATGEYTKLYLPAVIDEVLGTTLSPRYCFIHKDELERRARLDQGYESLRQAVKDGRIKNLHTWMMTHGRTAFNRRFQNIAMNAEDQWCREVYIRGGGADEKDAPDGGWPGCLDMDRSLGDKRKDWKLYVVGVDPEGGRTKSTNARFACLTLACDPQDPVMRYVVDIDVGRYPLESDNPHTTTQAGLILKHAKAYGAKVIIESNAQQAGWQGVVKKLGREKGVVISPEGHWTDAKKHDPEIGVKAMAPMLENGYLRLPYKTAHDQRIVNELIDELIYWGVNPTKDIVMALWFANNRMERMVSASRVADFNAGPDRTYVNRLATTHYPQHWNEEQRKSWDEQQRRRKEEEREEREKMAVNA